MSYKQYGQQTRDGFYAKLYLFGHMPWIMTHVIQY